MTIEPGLSAEGFRRMKRWFRDFALRASKDMEAGNVEAVIRSDTTLAPFRIELEAFLSECVDSLYRGTRHHGA